MGLRAGLDWCGKSRPTGILCPNRPARRQSLYRLRYPAHRVCFFSSEFICVANPTVHLDKIRSKAAPVQAWTGPEGSRSLRLPDFKIIRT